MPTRRLAVAFCFVLAATACAGSQGAGAHESTRVATARASLVRATQAEELARAPSSTPAAHRWARQAAIHRTERATGEARVELARARCAGNAGLDAAAMQYDQASARFAQAIDRCVAVQEDFEHMQNAPGYNAADEDEDETRADDSVVAVTRAREAWRTALEAVTSRCP